MVDSGIAKDITTCPTTPIININHKAFRFIVKNTDIIIPHKNKELARYTKIFLNQIAVNTIKDIALIGIV